jgi:hypothetical protein
MYVGRTLFWFKDGDELLTTLNKKFFGLGILLNRLLNEKYDGKKIKFINLDFSTNKTYKLFLNLPKGDAYYYGGHLRYYGVFDKEQFDRLSREEQNNYVWNNACLNIKNLADSMKNWKLLEAANYAYVKGIELNLNPDYRMVETEIKFLGQQLKASVWVNFKDDGMFSKFTLECEGNTILEKDIDKTENGVEFFLESYKAIELENNNIVIKGNKNVDYLPLKISLTKLIL